MSRLAVTWVRSAIGYDKDQRRTLQALGFHRLNETVEHDDSPSIRGMIRRVRHLVAVEEVSEAK